MVPASAAPPSSAPPINAPLLTLLPACLPACLPSCLPACLPAYHCCLPTTAARHTPLQARLRRETPFICTIKFANDIPEPPSDPKLLVSEADPRQAAAWILSSE